MEERREETEVRRDEIALLLEEMSKLIFKANGYLRQLCVDKYEEKDEDQDKDNRLQVQIKEGQSAIRRTAAKIDKKEEKTRT
jgi:hypothetical protein